MNKSKNYTLKVLQNGEKVDYIRTHSIRIFYKHLRTINWQNSPCTYIRVSYGKKLNHKNKLETFYNDGWYDNEKELLEVFKAFNDEE